MPNDGWRAPSASYRPLELVRMRGPRQRVLVLDQLLADETRQRFLQRDRSLPARDRDLLMQVLQRVLADVLACAVADHEQLGGGNTAAADARQEHLRHQRR